jgi:hypothetical protein
MAAAEDGVSGAAWITTPARRPLLVRNGLRAVSEQGARSDTEIETARLHAADEVLATSLSRPRFQRRDRH